MSINEIKKLLGNKKLLIGTNEVLKNLRHNNIQKVFVSSNCKEDTLSDVKHFASFSEVEIVKMNIPNDELGIVCKKPFSVSVIGLLR